MSLSVPEHGRQQSRRPGCPTCGQVGDIFGVEVGNRGSVNFEVDDELTSVTLTLS